MSSPTLVARLRASPWTSILVRLVSISAALAVLAWIGRAATANTGAASPVPSPDAAATSVPPPSSSPPFPPSPPPAIPVVASITAARGRATPDDPVFLNHADEGELRRLPGIGAKRAEAIVQLRRRVGRFNRVEDLMRVKGIGRAAIKKWRPLVRLDTPATAPSSADGGQT